MYYLLTVGKEDEDIGGVVESFKKKTPFDLINYIVSQLYLQKCTYGEKYWKKTVSRDIVKRCLYQQLLEIDAHWIYIVKYAYGDIFIMINSYGSYLATTLMGAIVLEKDTQWGYILVVYFV